MEAPPKASREMVARTDIDFDGLAKQLKPLGNATRLRLLHVLTVPLYLEEVAEKLHMSRQGARRHLDELVSLGVLSKQHGRRDFGPVTEYVLDHSRLFKIGSEFNKLGSLRPKARADGGVTVDRAATVLPGRARAAGEPCLALVRGVGEGQCYPLADQPGRVWTIGRSRDSDIRLDYDPFLSNRHAEVRRDARGFHLVDAFSRNGTHLNWERLGKGASASLERGDVVGVGNSLLVLQKLPV